MQWKGFTSLSHIARLNIQGGEGRALAADLRALEQYLRDMSTRLAKLVATEPVAIAGGTTNYIGVDVSADPTASVILTPVNGVLTTYMRSDAAPPLSQAIAPTWTAAHTFSSSVTLNGTVTLGASATAAPVNVDLAAASSGSATTISRSDHKHDLSENIAPTWTGTHTFSLESVHNGGVDLGTSGRLDSNVANAAAASSFLLQPTVAQTSGTDRWIFAIKNQAGAYTIQNLSSGQWRFGNHSSAIGYINVAGTRTEAIGIDFAPLINSAGITPVLGNFTPPNSILSSLFRGFDAAGATATTIIGGAFTAQPKVASRSITNLIGGVFVASPTEAVASTTVTNAIAAYIAGYIAAGTNIPIPTNWYGIYVKATSQGVNRYGMFCEAQTGGATTNSTIWIDGAGTLDFRATTQRIYSSGASTLDIVGPTINLTGAVVGSSTISAATAFQPDAADGATLGTAALEFSDLYLAEGGVIYFGSAQDANITHVTGPTITINVPTITFDCGAGGSLGCVMQDPDCGGGNNKNNPWVFLSQGSGDTVTASPSYDPTGFAFKRKYGTEGSHTIWTNKNDDAIARLYWNGSLDVGPTLRTIYNGTTIGGINTASGGQTTLSASGATPIVALNAGADNVAVYATYTRIGDIGGGDYVNIDHTDGHLTLAGNATVWDDLRVDATVTKPGVTNPPGFEAFLGGTYVYYFSPSADEEVYFSVQLPHNWKQNSVIYPHVHWAPKTNSDEDPASQKVCWALEYTWANRSTTFPATATVTGTDHTPAEALVQDRHYVTSLTSIDPGDDQDEMSSMLICRLYRDVSDAADTYEDDAGLLEFDIHYEIDSLGSNTASSKA